MLKCWLHLIPDWRVTIRLVAQIHWYLILDVFSPVQCTDHTHLCYDKIILFAVGGYDI